jgi:putative phosphoribosyl transferase
MPRTNDAPELNVATRSMGRTTLVGGIEATSIRVMLFKDRLDAGRCLAERLRGLPLKSEDLVVLGLPRGGVPLAFEAARALGAPLDVIVVRKVGVPFQPELAMGAIGEGGVRIVNEEVVRMIGVSAAEFDAAEAREREELDRRAARFRGARERVLLTGRTALIVDDGIATGSTVRAACKVARAQGAARIVVATPVAAPHTVADLSDDADEVIALYTPEQFFAIGQFYEDFAQTSDDEVVRLLAAKPDATPVAAAGAVADPPSRDEEVQVRAGAARVGGHLTVPEGATAIVVFAHGSGSSRHSPRNRFVASVLNRAGLGTLLFDLLTVSEELDRANVFDIELLARRLIDVTQWLRTQPDGRDVAIGYFGASTGAAAALWAAAAPEADVAAVVSRGGRPDLAAPKLGDVRAPTLLIVGSNDTVVLELNREAQSELRCENRLSVVPGASHLFEERGTLTIAAELARDWFVDRLTPVGHPAA